MRVAGMSLVLAVAAGSAAGQVLRFDVNGLDFQAFDEGSQASPFGGLSHTGSVEFLDAAGTGMTIGIREGQGLPFVDQGFTGLIADVRVLVTLDGGAVTGGSIEYLVNPAGVATDVYTAQIGPGGTVTEFAGMYRISGELTFDGQFSSGLFGNVDVSRWFDAQAGEGLFGSFFSFDIVPDSTGAGTGADMEHYVNVPAPGAAAGIALAGAALAGRRRRSGV